MVPNHFHGIIVIVGAALCGRPDLADHHGLGGRPGLGSHPEMDVQWKTGQRRKIGQPHRVAPTNTWKTLLNPTSRWFPDFA
jgi:hypothetical protein